MPTATGKTRSPEVARFLNIAWRPISLPTAAGDRYGSSRIPLTSYFQDALAGAERPAWVYIHAPEKDPESTKELEEDIFGKDELLVASHFFDCYRISADELSEDERKSLAKRLPAFVLVGTDGRIAAQHKGSAHPDGLLSFLSKGFKTAYGTGIESRLERFKDVLRRLEAAEDDVAEASQKLKDTAAAAKPDKPKDLERVEKAREVLAKAQGVLASLREERTKLLDVSIKS